LSKVKATPEKRARGQPSKFDKINKELVFNLYESGLTDKQVAKIIKVTVTTVQNWKIAHPNFFDSIKDSRKYSDGAVVASLYKRCLGFEYKETTREASKDDPKLKITKVVTKFMPPDVGAAFGWLYNRQPEDWKQRKHVEVTGDVKYMHFFEEMVTKHQFTPERLKAHANQSRN